MPVIDAGRPNVTIGGTVPKAGIPDLRVCVCVWYMQVCL